MMPKILAFAAAVSILGPAALRADDTVRIGSKNFTEQHVLGELVAQLLEENTDLRIERKFGLGGTGLCHAALVAGELDLYVEYTGTALLDILKLPPRRNADEVYRGVAREYRERFDLIWLPPLGFNNTYVLAVREDQAARNGWNVVSGLRDAAPALAAGFTGEFTERPDGYPGLQKTYGLRFRRTLDLDPGLLYEALKAGQVDAICAFATDGRIAAYGLRVLADDKNFFPPYHAAPVARRELLERRPEIAETLAALAGTIHDDSMRRLNYEVDVRKRAPRDVARDWLQQRRGGEPPASRAVSEARPPAERRFWALLVDRRAQLLQKIHEHLWLTGVALALAIIIGVPAGTLIARRVAWAGPVLAAAEMVQTIPSLAMLAFLFALFKVLGALPAIVALVLYALLPIVLNTFTGLRKVPPETLEAADGLGLSARQRLWWVEFPLALPMIVAGVRTAAVWTVGIATLSTYIGAGGLGDFISRGLARNDSFLTLLGAVPAALLAVLLSLLIREIEKRLVRM